MFGIIEHVAVGFKCIFVLVEPLYEAPPSLPCCSPGMSICTPWIAYILSGVHYFSISSFWMVLFVCSAILNFVLLNRFVIIVVSLPVYVKEAHFCVAVSVHLKWWWDVCGWVFCVCGQENHCLT